MDKDMEKSYEAAAVSLASRSCLSCKLRKKRCGKELPRCRVCLRFGRRCEYGNKGRQPDVIPASRELLSQRPCQRPNTVFPAVFFLDKNVFEHCEVPIQPEGLPLSPGVIELLGDTEAIRTDAARYFNASHNWIPIISRSRFYGTLLNPWSPMSADLALLFLCMKLLVSVPGESGPQTALYSAAKQFYTSVEAAGFFTMHLIQAGILIALYEFGHAIYPAAYMTIAVCARYGVALGINNESSSPDGIFNRWMEKEERIRTWWAVIILDRLVNLGCPSRCLCTEDPEMDSLLPIDDEQWDQGVMSSSEPIKLSSAPTVMTGRFARLAQAVNLLSQTLRHISDGNANDRYYQAQAAQLDRTVLALMSLIEVEGQTRNIIFCCPVAVCMSTMLMIHAPSVRNSCAKPPGLEISQYARLSVESLLRQSLIIIHEFGAGLRGKIDELSPMLLDWLYRVASMFIHLYQEEGDPKYLEGKMKVLDILKLIYPRWAVAGSYLQILEAREVAKVPL